MTRDFLLLLSFSTYILMNRTFMQVAVDPLYIQYAPAPLEAAIQLVRPRYVVSDMNVLKYEHMMIVVVYCTRCQMSVRHSTSLV